MTDATMSTATPKMLDISAAHGKLNELGVQCSRRQVQRWAYDRSLPFHKPVFGNKLLIREDKLIAAATGHSAPNGHKLATETNGRKRRG